MRKVIFLSVGVVFGCSLTVAGWGANGHRMIGEAAARGLPQDMPAFLRAASDQLAFLNPEPDLQRDARERAFGPWLLGSVQDHHVFLDVVPLDVLRAPDRYTYLDMLAKRAIVSSIQPPGPAPQLRPGLLPFRILELTQQLRIGFRRWRETTDPQEMSQ